MQTLQAAIPDVQIFNSAAEAHLAAHGLDPAANGFDHGRQAITPRMGSLVVEYGGLTFALREQFQHPAHVRPGVAAGQLAVAERPGSAFSEKVVALGVERAAAIEGVDVADAVPHRSAA